MTSKMPQVYLHYFGTESANSILEAYGIIKNESLRTNLLKPIRCPNCNELNNKETRICVSCKMILKYDAYTETLDEKESKEKEILMLKESFNNEILKLKGQITEDLRKELKELLIRL